MTTVTQAWAAVMADVRELAKADRNTAPNANYNFRGIDAVMNAVGPILRKHQVAVIPTDVRTSHRDVQTSTGKPSREATVVVTYTIVGPEGDSITGMAPGEAMDSGDKGTPKAMSVAMRTFLLQALCLPTQDTDPDAQTYERANHVTNPLSAARVEVVEAWKASHDGLFDKDACANDYEQRYALAFQDAGPEELRNYANELRNEKP